MPITDASRPLYHRVYREIVHEIESGALGPGDRLPSERWFCDELGVSRATVRRAIEELTADGLVESRGRGTYVSGAALVEPPNTLVSLSELGRSRGLTATARVLGSATRPATIDEAEAFGIAPGAELFELERLRMLDGLPISIDHNRIPLRFLPAPAELDFTTDSLYDALERGGHAPVRADYELEARAADAPEAELLDVAPGAPVLLAITSAIGDDGRIIDLGRTVYRADRYRFQATLMRRAQQRNREGIHDEAPGQRGAGGRAGDLHRRLRRDAGGGQAERAGGRNSG
ncbi:MAG TPA: GntR family transcriptional regulator [Solirubrobacteraceae bacterium]|nr:GntR family transcriptional regulator [Solirubrobacteraceae bacterium]